MSKTFAPQALQQRGGAGLSLDRVVLEVLKTSMRLRLRHEGVTIADLGQAVQSTIAGARHAGLNWGLRPLGFAGRHGHWTACDKTCWAARSPCLNPQAWRPCDLLLTLNLEDVGSNGKDQN